jgi:hypothetical protein
MEKSELTHRRLVHITKEQFEENNYETQVIVERQKRITEELLKQQQSDVKPYIHEVLDTSLTGL